MKTSIAYEVFLFFEGILFENLLILNALYQKYVANITFKQFTKCYFTLWFYNFVKNLAKEKKKIIAF